MRVDNVSNSFIEESVKIIHTAIQQSSEMSQKLTPEGITSLDKVEIQSKKSDVMNKDILKDPEELKKLIKELTSKLTYLNSQLKIEIDSEIGQPIVKIIDINTNEVMRQVPPDYIINIIKNINKLLGVLFEDKA